jgi:hypothetical protein
MVSTGAGGSAAREAGAADDRVRSLYAELRREARRRSGFAVARRRNRVPRPPWSRWRAAGGGSYMTAAGRAQRARTSTTSLSAPVESR